MVHADAALEQPLEARDLREDAVAAREALDGRVEEDVDARLLARVRQVDGREALEGALLALLLREGEDDAGEQLLGTEDLDCGQMGGGAPGAFLVFLRSAPIANALMLSHACRSFGVPPPPARPAVLAARGPCEAAAPRFVRRALSFSAAAL